MKNKKEKGENREIRTKSSRKRKGGRQTSDCFWALNLHQISKKNERKIKGKE